MLGSASCESSKIWKSSKFMGSLAFKDSDLYEGISDSVYIK